MLKLIADSGSTKTDWVLLDGNGEVKWSGKSQGLNPYHMSEEEILRVLREDVWKKMSSSKDVELSGLKAVFFYGSGVTEAMRPMMESLLSRVFVGADVHAESDMLGAARALLGNEKGIAVILGTGSNNCYYDGERIVDGIPPLGYILGDECSGTAIGKAFLRIVLRNPEATPLKDKFFSEYQLDYATIINKVYREPMANRFLASIAPFVANEMDEYFDLLLPIVEMFNDFTSEMLCQNYKDILERHDVDVKKAKKIPIGFVGSIAYYFSDCLVDIDKPFYLKEIQKSPMKGLIRFHTENI